MASTEYGIFNDEGMIAGDFWSEEEAFATLCVRYPDDPNADIGEVCPVCRDMELTPEGCEDCDAPITAPLAW
ncbi:hypothetical protein SEA_BANTAM_152 [Gordonia phage Bantam]|uniref:Uncharacterized protein n=1 Tax=Gordonia phage Bantam TaxID=1887641 RepID=A0A1B3AYN2_9CAUD|nr:hypothetical protein BIZ77_gp027 [Gordonia phage Bantam]AOE43841.1 hypothetical protein SEA_BANTAM_152 [Gordonia phage Bantam]